MHAMDGDARKKVWKTYLGWVVCINLAFFISYPLCNWIASQRTETLGLYFDAERHIPFVPQFIWIYFSMNLLFVAPPFLLDVGQLHALGRRLLVGTALASLVFLLVPTHLGFSRALPLDPFYRPVFSGLFMWDQPHNLVPSLHVLYSAVTVFAYLKTKPRRLVRALWLTWLVLIMASTLLVHQHHLIDVFAGLLAAWAIQRWVGTSRIASSLNTAGLADC